MLTDTQVSLIFALSRGEAGVGGPIVGWMVDKFDSRPIVLVFGLMAGVGTASASRGWTATGCSCWSTWAIVSVGNNSGFGQTFLAVTNRWFVRRRAVGMTLVITCYTAGGAMLIPVLSRGVEALGWREVMLFTGIFVAVIVIPVLPPHPPVARRAGIDLAEAGEAVEQVVGPILVGPVVRTRFHGARSPGSPPPTGPILFGQRLSHLGHQRNPGPRHPHHGMEGHLGADREPT